MTLQQPGFAAIFGDEPVRAHYHPTVAVVPAPTRLRRSEEFGPKTE
jgi:hypothetical protein